MSHTVRISTVHTFYSDVYGRKNQNLCYILRILICPDSIVVAVNTRASLVHYKTSPNAIFEASVRTPVLVHFSILVHSMTF